MSSSSYMPGPPHTLPDNPPTSIQVERARASVTRLSSQPAILALAGRVLFSLIFIVASFGDFTQKNINYAAEAGVPYASVLVPLAGVISLIGGLCILLGFYTRVGAWLIVIFLIPVTVFMHNFWATADAAARADQLAHFLKNVSMLGAALFIAYFGAGPMSIDRRR